LPDIIKIIESYRMKPSCAPNSQLASLFSLSVFLLLFTGPVFTGQGFFAQTKSQFPSRASHVNDFAGVVDAETRQRLELLLENLKVRSGIQLDLATVESTQGQDIFDFSRRLSQAWGIGSRTSQKKSLLLVMAVNEKAIFIQFSKSAQGLLPDGVLGEMTQRMRALLALGQFTQSLSDGVQYFVNRLAQAFGFNLEGMQQAPESASGGSTGSSTTVVETTRGITESAAGPVTSSGRVAARNPRRRPTAAAAKTAIQQKNNSSTDDEDESEEVELTLTLPLDRRVVRLKEFLEAHANSKSKPRALELLVSAHAGLGDQKLKNGDSSGGIEQLMLAIEEAPGDISEKLFSGVISQIPLNLYLRGERNAAFKAAQNIESKFGNEPQRLLGLAGFYLGIEQGSEAVRLARQALTLAPDMAEAHHALGLALHISLRLEDAATEYKRALELEPNSKGTRRSIADLNRALGKTEEALALYREQLTAEPADKAARAGLVVSLFELGRMDEANKEMEAALKEDPHNLPLLAGAAYWFAAHNDTKQALEYARKAVEAEPRYTWAQIALSRALIGQKRPLEAERAIRYARQYGKFPTLDYELANVLTAAGLYDEAVEALLGLFTIRDGQIETRLAGHLLTHAASFEELLAAERQASIFQLSSADTPANSTVMKALLVFAMALNPQSESDKIDEASASAAAREFSSGDDDMRVYRELYAASRLLRKGVGVQTAFDLTESARRRVDAALTVPAVTVAVQADEFREIRARAISSGVAPDISEAPRNVLSNLLRGRIEDLSGWALFNQDRVPQAIEHLKLAAGVLPPGTPGWRTALWHLGAALDQNGNKEEALDNYIKSYNSGEPDPARRSLIEQLYKRVKGSLEGLEERIGGSTANVNSGQQTVVAESTTETAKPAAGDLSTRASEPTVQPAAIESVASSRPSSKAEPTATPQQSASATPESSVVEPTPTPDNLSSTTVDSAALPRPTPSETPSPSPVQTEAVGQTSSSLTRDSSLPGIPTTLRATVKIGGRIKDASNNGIPNVVMVLISPRGSVIASTTDADGAYSFAVSPSQRSYRIIPSKDGLIFEPFDKILTGLSEDQKELDFVGKQSP